MRDSDGPAVLCALQSVDVSAAAAYPRAAMAYIDVKNVVVLDNPAPFLAPFRFEITFDCTGQLNDGTTTPERAVLRPCSDQALTAQ